MNYDSFSHKQFNLFCDSSVSRRQLVDIFEEAFEAFKEKNIPEFSRKEINDIFLLFSEENCDYFNLFFEDQKINCEQIVMTSLIETKNDVSKWVVNISDRTFYLSLVMKEVEQYIQNDFRDKITELALDCEICLFYYDFPKEDFSSETIRGYVPIETRVFDLKDIFEVFSSVENGKEKTWKRNSFPTIMFSKRQPSHALGKLKTAFITFGKNTGDALAAKMIANNIMINGTICTFDFAFDKNKRKYRETNVIDYEKNIFDPLHEPPEALDFMSFTQTSTSPPKFGARIKPILASL